MAPAVRDPKDVSTGVAHVRLLGDALRHQAGDGGAGYKAAGRRRQQGLVEATEALTAFPEGNEHPQGDKTFNGKIHQAFGHQNISKVEGGKLKVVHRTAIEDGLYEPEGDYTTQPL